MEKVIEGKVYNTETATLIGRNESGSKSDFRWISEGLYKTPRGRYFLAGEGGPMTHYAHKCGDNCWGSGDGIIPLDEEDAREWAERYCDTDTVIRYFATEEA